MLIRGNKPPSFSPVVFLMEGINNVRFFHGHAETSSNRSLSRQRRQLIRYRPTAAAAQCNGLAHTKRIHTYARKHAHTRTRRTHLPSNIRPHTNTYMNTRTRVRNQL
jgi:hypothetical protein